MPPTPSASESWRPLVLELDRLRLRVDHRKGGGIVDAHWRQGDRWLPVIARGVAGEDPVANQSSFIMAPWCNRVRDAVFTWNTPPRRIALRADPRDGTAMHGDVRKRPFELLDRSPVSARLRFDSRAFNDVNFPWPFTVETRFEVGEASITQEVTLTNTGDEAFPCGVGIHPYIPRVQAGEPVGARLIAPVGGRFPSDRCMPIAPARRDARCRWLSGARGLPSHYFMDSFTGYQNVCVVEWARTRLTMTSSENHRHMVFFAPTKANGMTEPFFAVEPMTIAADGFNLLARGERDSGVTVLKAGEALRTWYRFGVEDR